ncbi:hypothetical protein [endosymbiont of unidentified scaly snail isolate Monju]|uniref:hypothetical protein n=1 Tax=endosymbiont of unidentified scaly snail isolate Monju TaxID=1248727 RepID=UPI0011DD5850|nr:hypothetical protein [endosymbiont of unidentified scaly snail isolate Monju]
MVFEFGGGYGSMARLFWQLGFRGKYLIQDLPAFSALQKFYLGSIGALGSESGDGEFSFVTDNRSMKRILDRWGAVESKMFVATWSLSETPLEVREPVLDSLVYFDHILIAFQHQFEDIDNVKYFHGWASAMADTHSFQVSHIDHLPGNSYLFMSRV